VWGRVVLDESHIIRNGHKKFPPAIAAGVYRMVGKSRFRWCISGTPFRNRSKDLFSQAKFIHDSSNPKYHDKEWWDGAQSESVSEWLDRYMIRSATNDLVESKVVYVDREIDPTEEELQSISRMRGVGAGLWVQMENTENAEEKAQYRKQILELIMGLRVAANCLHTNACGSSKTLSNFMRCSKIARIVSDVNEGVYTDSKNGVVIFSQFTQFLGILKTVLEAHSEADVMSYDGSMSDSARKKVVHEFNTMRIPRVLLISLMAGGESLSLHEGSGTVILCEPSFEPFAEQQAAKRVCRIGQTATHVRIIRYWLKDGVEGWVNEIKKRKLEMAGQIGLCDVTKKKTLTDSEIGRLFQMNVGYEENKGKPVKSRRRWEDNVGTAKAVKAAKRSVFLEEGNRNESEREWWRPGVLKTDHRYSNGLRHGISRDWHDNGKLKEFSTWRAGKQDGLCRMWYSNGNMRENSVYKNDCLSGRYQTWDHSGKNLEDMVWGGGVSGGISDTGERSAASRKIVTDALIPDNYV